MNAYNETWAVKFQHISSMCTTLIFKIILVLILVFSLCKGLQLDCQNTGLDINFLQKPVVDMNP